MAVEKIKKLSVIGLNSQKEQIMRDIAFTGSVEFTDQTEKLSDEDWASLASNDVPVTLDLEGKLSSVKAAIDALSPFAISKKLLSGKPEKSSEEFFNAVCDNEMDETAFKVGSVLRDMERLCGRINTLEQKIKTLEPWDSLNLPMSIRSTVSTGIIYGTLPLSENTDQIISVLQSDVKEANLTVVSSDRQYTFVQIIVHKEALCDIMERLKSHMFTQTLVSDDLGLAPGELIIKYGEEIKGLNAEVEAFKSELKSYNAFLPRLEFYCDAINGALLAENTRSRLLVTKDTFLMEGFVPQRVCAEIEKRLQKYTVHTVFEEPSPDDNVPTLLRNNAAVQPYEMVTSMYSLPEYGGLDPNSIVAPFFCIFFGMMLSDFGYGLILFLLGLIAPKRIKLTGAVKRFCGLMVQGGLSAMLFGIIYGSYFGDAVSVVSRSFFGKEIVLRPFFDPMSNPMTMLYACIVIGFIQIVVGMGANAYQMIKNGNLIDAVYDVGFWYIVFAGLILVILNFDAGKYVALMGAAGLVFTQGRSKKGIISRFTSGLLSLYGITGYMSDLLSYSRLMALGLSTGVIASVFNKLGSLSGKGFFGVLFFTLIFIIGQVFNLAMSALGAYVHSSRLTYVEFFGKFFSGGGREFSPLKYENRYVSLKYQQEK